MSTDATPPAAPVAAWRGRLRVLDDTSRPSPNASPGSHAPYVDLPDALREVRTVVAEAHYPLDLPGAEPARDRAEALRAQLDDYLIPRLRRIDAPLLGVVGGSTGAGKSTLVNSLVRTPVSRTGVLRPTTRSPLLVSNPADTAWFAQAVLLPELARSSRSAERVLQLVNAPALHRGIALLDAPDIDSVVAANRELAAQLMAAGDLWLFVTTAARYADAVPWRLLRAARDRGTAVAIVLDRVPPEAVDAITDHFGQMLIAQDMSAAPLFVIRESTLDGHGLLPEGEVTAVKEWLDEVAGSTVRRQSVTVRTLLGAVHSVPGQLDELALAADDQLAAQSRLATGARRAFAGAMSDVESQVRSGAVLRGDVYAQWLQLLGTGELAQALRSATHRGRDEALPVPSNLAHPGVDFIAAVTSALAGLISEADVIGAARCRDGWRAEPAGRLLLGADSGLGRPWPGFTDASHDLVHDWQRWLRAVVRGDAAPVRTPSRPYASAATVLFATIVAVAPPRSTITADGPATEILRTALGDETVRALGERARADLLVRVGNLLELELERHLAPVAALDPDPGLPTRLRAAAGRVRAAVSSSPTGAAA